MRQRGPFTRYFAGEVRILRKISSQECRGSRITRNLNYIMKGWSHACIARVPKNRDEKENLEARRSGGTPPSVDQMEIVLARRNRHILDLSSEILTITLSGRKVTGHVAETRGEGSVKKGPSGHNNHPPCHYFRFLRIQPH